MAGTTEQEMAIESRACKAARFSTGEFCPLVAVCQFPLPCGVARGGEWSIAV